jgi:hypothetical protein
LKDDAVDHVARRRVRHDCCRAVGDGGLAEHRQGSAHGDYRALLIKPPLYLEAQGGDAAVEAPDHLFHFERFAPGAMVAGNQVGLLQEDGLAIHGKCVQKRRHVSFFTSGKLRVTDEMIGGKVHQ